MRLTCHNLEGSAILAKIDRIAEAQTVTTIAASDTFFRYLPNRIFMQIIKPRTSDLGDGFMVRRALPSAQCRSVGPFVFLDEMGPADFQPGSGLAVRPHPHIGLATVTYLFEGEIEHRDSVGSFAHIRPGDVNWMTAGRGIVHSERTSDLLRMTGSRLWGLQFWVALPVELEQCEPSFVHHDASELPRLDQSHANLHVVLGTAYGQTSPVRVASPMFLVDVRLASHGHLELESHYPQRAAYIVQGEVDVDGSQYGPGHLLVFEEGATVTIKSGHPGAHFVLLGGKALDGPRFISWNFVASSKALIENAQQRWKDQTFPKVPGETEFIPLPS